jgi:hypothetical protein
MLGGNKVKSRIAIILIFTFLTLPCSDAKSGTEITATYLVAHDHGGNIEPGFIVLYSNGQLRWVSEICNRSFAVYYSQVKEVAKNSAAGGFHIKLIGNMNFNFMRLESPQVPAASIDQMVSDIESNLNSQSHESSSWYTMILKGIAPVDGLVFERGKGIPKKSVSIPIDSPELRGTSFLSDDKYLYVFNTESNSNDEKMKSLRVRKMYLESIYADESPLPDFASLVEAKRLDQSSGEAWGEALTLTANAINVARGRPISPSVTENTEMEKAGVTKALEGVVGGIIDQKIKQEFKQYFPKAEFYRFENNSHVLEIDTKAGPFSQKFAEGMYQALRENDQQFNQLIGGMLLKGYDSILIKMNKCSLVLSSKADYRTLCEELSNDSWYVGLQGRVAQ